MDALNSGKTVSVIIITWNSERFVKDAVDAVLSQNYDDFELIIVDNGSTDGTARTIRKNYSKDKRVRFIFNKFNIGFSAANNQGFYIAKGDYILFLNPDTKLDKNYLRQALKGFEDSSVGAVSGRILRFDRKTIDSAGQTLGKNRRAIERGYGKPDCDEYQQESYCFSVCGAAAFYRRKAIIDISLNGQFFDEGYFAFYEDLDAGWRLNLMGWRCRYLPKAVVYHHRGGSNLTNKGLSRFYQIAAKSPNVQADIICNRWYTILKNDNLFNYLVHFPWIIIYEIKTFCYLLFFNRKIFRKVFKAFFRRYEDMRKKRRLIKRKTVIGPGTVRKRMKI